VIVEYPFSRHSGDALLALAQLEMARGDRDPAIDHLQRFLLQRPNDPDHVRAGIWLGRLLLEQNQLAKGCAVLLRTRASLGDTSVEVRNQVDYYASRCIGVDTVAPVRTAVAASAKAARGDTAPPINRAPRDTTHGEIAHRMAPVRDTTRRDSTRRIAKPRDTLTKAAARARSTPPPNETKQSASGRYTVQVAAYDTRDAAEQLVNRLSARGIVARVVTSASAPYRVRVGRYATDAEATVAARELKEKGIVGFVTTTDNESAGAPPRR
jgi:cell division septation protein DedD